MTGNARGSVKITFSFVAVVNPITPPIRNGLVDAPKPVVEKEPAPFAIDIYIKSIGNDDVNAVNARELWVKLEVKTDFSDWIKGRIDKYEFLQDVDFISLKNKVNDYNGLEVVKSIDFFISLDMAKELSMVENNDQGKSARRYFIECEKQAVLNAPKI